MSNDNPILNNPYEEPRFHYNVDINGNLDYGSILEGRRPRNFLIRRRIIKSIDDRIK